ncbi:MAG: integration host factor subunit beta [Holosporales bacterium]|nr:integration host factor subunit beta [Holosporales bacterium]
MLELVQKFNDAHRYMNHADAHKAASIIMNSIKEALVSCRKVELRGFGTFSIRERKARIGRNPKTGKAVKIPSMKTPFFKAGKLLTKFVNSD